MVLARKNIPDLLSEKVDWFVLDDLQKKMEILALNENKKNEKDLSRVDT